VLTPRLNWETKRALAISCFEITGKKESYVQAVWKEERGEKKGTKKTHTHNPK
jgi:hypothetical protein